MGLVPNAGGTACATEAIPQCSKLLVGQAVPPASYFYLRDVFESVDDKAPCIPQARWQNRAA